MTAKKRILICDDEEGVRESLKLILEDDYKLSFAKTGEEAAEKVKEGQIDLAILDIKMPKISGIDTLKMIRKISPKTKVIMVSGYKSVEAASEAINSGASEYIVKPFNTSQVLKSVEKTVAQ